jgi:hypothetical protein
VADLPYSKTGNQQSYQQFLLKTFLNNAVTAKRQRSSPDRAHSACLRPFIAKFFGERNLGANLQALETTIQNTIFVKIKLSSIRRF